MGVVHFLPVRPRRKMTLTQTLDGRISWIVSYRDEDTVGVCDTISEAFTEAMKEWNRVDSVQRGETV